MELADTPKILTRVAAAVPATLVRVRSGPFALVEHLWHLADLEREGFGARIVRLMDEDDPFLPDFDGERIAREREYLRKDAASALAAFAAARAENLARLLAVTDPARAGRQEGVGRVTLGEMPRRMLEHDLAHFNELADLLEELVPRHPLIGELRNRGPHTSRAA